MRPVFTVLAASLLALASAAATHAHGYRIGDLRIEHPWARPTVSDRTPGAAYFVVTNRGETNDRLIEVRPHPDFAGRGEIHTHIDDGGVLRMREVEDGLIIPAGAEVALQPGGLHIMLYELAGPLHEGDLHAMTLVFERSGEIEVAFYVQHPPMDGGTHRH
jgi:copper(I)-binding protein